jgi:hypothetical protein
MRAYVDGEAEGRSARKLDSGRQIVSSRLGPVETNTDGAPDFSSRNRT